MASQQKAICWDTLLAAKVLESLTGYLKVKLSSCDFLEDQENQKGKGKLLKRKKSTSNAPTDDDHMRILSDSDDDVPKDGVFSTNSFDDENTDNEEDGAPELQRNIDHTIDVSSISTLRIIKNHPRVRLLAKMTREDWKLNGFLEHEDERGYYFIKIKARLVAPWVRKRMVWIMMKFCFSARIEASDSFWNLNLSWALLSIIWMSKVHFYMATSQKEVYVKQPPGFEDPAIKQGLQSSQGTLWLTSSPKSMAKMKRVKMLMYIFIGFKSLQRVLRMMLLRIFRYLKHQPKLGLWYPKDSPFHLEAFSDSDYAGDNHDRRSTSGGCQYLDAETGLFIQLFLNKQLEGVTRPQNFLPSVTLPSKVFTFMRKNSPKFSGRITPLTLPMLEVIIALAAKEAHSESTHSRATSSPRDTQGSPTQSAAQANESKHLEEMRSFGSLCFKQGGGGSRVQTISQAKQIHKLKAKLKKLKRVETEQAGIIIRIKDTSDVKSRDTEELDLERIQSTARQSAVTPRTLNFDDEAGPSSPIRPTQEEEPEEQFKDDEFLADIPLNISRPRGLSIPGPMQSQPQQPTQTTDPKEKVGILVESPNREIKLFQQIRALETAHDEEVARKVQAEWDAEKERKRLEDLKKPKPKTFSKETNLYTKNNLMMSFLKGQRIHEYTKNEYLKTSAKIESQLEPFSMIKEFKRLQQVNDDFCEEARDWEIIRWRLNESSGVHTLELEDGTMLHMLAERRYPLSRELMIRMLDHGMEVEDESETAITLIHLFILWTTKDGDDS
ncbi:hypothetical protein Tco_1006596 [Tanacetum coccineum]|uniref:Uncharacterized protein n=1 Tax=Tanacetum coccineum TaxID=301880 RepID=A0ABQ5FJI8_9ASTR